MYAKARWNSAVHGSMTESAIRTIHNAPDQARVSVYVYDAGEEIEGTSKPCTFYVIQGRFTLIMDAGTASLEPGDVFVFSGGDYILRIESDAMVIWAWELRHPSV